MAEQVLSAVPVHERRAFRSPEQYAFVVTDRRTILVPFTREMLARAGEEATDAARAEGKGFFGRWGAKVQAVTGYAQPFLAMDPEAVARQPGALVMENTSVVAVRLGEMSDEDSSSTSWTIHLKLSDGKRTFELRAQPGNLATAMRQAYGDRFRD